MKPNLLKPLFFILLCAILLGIGLLQSPRRAAAQSEISTPTFDPLIETPLPPNPTELELGQNLYWHWCMTCHGDQGQGLTDAFREVWVEDHQNCWARGCHAGRPGDTGFPIPTYVPGIVVEDHLAQFASLQGFADYLKATHPPQSPGVLADEEYHAIALFVFTMNGRAAETPIPASTPTRNVTPIPSSTETLPPSAGSSTASNSMRIGFVAAVVVVVSVSFFLVRRTRTRE